MRSELAAFGEMTSHLANTLVLIGWRSCSSLVYTGHSCARGSCRPSIEARAASSFNSLLRYGFWIAALLIALGIGYAGYKTYRETQAGIATAETASKAIEALTEQLRTKDLQVQEYQDQNKALTEAVQALAKKQDTPGVQEALAALAEGQTQAAKAIFAKNVEAKSAEGAAADREAAEAARHLGALAFLDNTEEALHWYRRAVELDPANADGWNRLGHLYYRTGQLDQAEAAFQKVVTLGEANDDLGAIAAGTGNLGLIYETRGEIDRAEEMYKKALAIEEKLGHQEGMAIAYGNLGLIYETRGEIDRAEEMHKKALAIDEKLGRQEGMADTYGNLGLIYQRRGELDRAEEMHKKALAIDEKLGRKEGMAIRYANLGLIYGTRGELDRAEEMYKKALALFKAVGAAPRVKVVQAWLDALNKSRGER